MGPCASQYHKKSQELHQKFPRYTPYELLHLELMFQDIKKRGSKPGIIREHFDTFFHLNGLWGDQMFRTFDKNHEGYITFQEFLHSIEIMVKGTFEEKARILFNFYDVDKTSGISFSQLIKMLFSYPKDEINRMVTEEKFLESIDEYQKNFYFHPQKLTLKDCNIVEEQSQSEEDKKSIKRISSFHGPSVKTYLGIQDMIGRSAQADKESRHNELIKLKNGETIQRLNSKDAIKNFLKGQKHFQSILTQTNIERQRKKYVVRSNIASLIRKYAAFLFKDFRLDTKKEQMSFEQFKQLIKNHQSIFDSYFEGFHSYIWQFDELTNTPEFKKHSAWIQGPCQFTGNLGNSEKYLYFAKTTIFVLNSAKSKKAQEIINMEGLSVEQIQEGTLSGFIIKHRDGIYPQKKILFTSKQIRDEWMSHLVEFKYKSIYDCYQFSQKVGEGNFSSVFKGLSKTTGEDVAIKVIKKFQLSQSEKNVLKSQCGILQLCHHPNILKLHEIFNTRTHLYIITQFLGEGDLFEYVKKQTFLEEYEAAFIMKQLVEVVKYFGMVDLIHRDLKPENIMIIMNKEKTMVQKIKIIDFGFAVYQNNLKNMSAKEKYAGTPGFLAPELLTGEDFDESVDIFSLGVILYFMLCGSLPFFSSFLEQIIQQTKQCNIVLRNAHWNNISDEAKDLVYKMVTFKNQRITLKQLSQHPWLKNIEDLKKYNRVNKKNRYIGV